MKKIFLLLSFFLFLPFTSNASVLWEQPLRNATSTQAGYEAVGQYNFASGHPLSATTIKAILVWGNFQTNLIGATTSIQICEASSTTSPCSLVLGTLDHKVVVADTQNDTTGNHGMVFYNTTGISIATNKDYTIQIAQFSVAGVSSSTYLWGANFNAVGGDDLYSGDDSVCAYVSISGIESCLHTYGNETVHDFAYLLCDTIASCENSVTSTIHVPLPTEFSSTSTLTNLNATCDEDSPFYVSSICHLFAFLFFPDPDTLTIFTGLQEELSNKFPFSYFYDFEDIISSLSQRGTSSVPVITLNLSTTTPNRINFTAELFGTTSLTTYVSASQLDTMRNFLLYSEYILFGLYTFFRIASLL